MRFKSKQTYEQTRTSEISDKLQITCCEAAVELAKACLNHNTVRSILNGPSRNFILKYCKSVPAALECDPSADPKFAPVPQNACCKEAVELAEAHLIQIAVDTILSGPDREFISAYRKLVCVRQQSLVEWAILRHDLLKSDAPIRAQFARCLVLIQLNLLKDCDNPHALNLLQRDEHELLNPFQGVPCLLTHFKNSVAKSKITTRQPNLDRLEGHCISILRRLIEFCDVSDNNMLYGLFTGSSGTDHFGDFDAQNIRSALSGSRLFSGFTMRRIDKLINKMMKDLPIRYPGNLHLPPELLKMLGYEHGRQFSAQYTYFYKENPILQKPENNLLVLLVSPVDRTVQHILLKWAALDGRAQQQKMIRDVRDSNTKEQLGLTLGALLCYQRLIPPTQDDSTDPINGSYLRDFKILLGGEHLNNEKEVFERMVLSIGRVLESFGDDCQNIRRSLYAIIERTSPIQHQFDSISDEYWRLRIQEALSHEAAFGRFKSLLQKIEELGTMNKSCQGTEDDSCPELMKGLHI